MSDVVEPRGRGNNGSIGALPVIIARDVLCMPDHLDRMVEIVIGVLMRGGPVKRLPYEILYILFLIDN